MKRLWLYPILFCIVLFAVATVSYAAPVGMIGYVQADGLDYLRGYKAICEQRGIEYDLIAESDIADLGVLAGYDVLVVVTGIGQRVGLPEDAIAALKAYLLAGGSVIMEQHALNGFRGLPIRGGGAPKVPEITITATDHPITAGFAEGDKIAYGGAAKRVAINEPEVAKVLADTDQGPGLVVVTAGRGQLIYSSICLSLVAGDVNSRAVARVAVEDAVMYVQPPGTGQVYAGAGAGAGVVVHYRVETDVGVGILTADAAAQRRAQVC